jgi:hypothetical protein
MTDIVIEQASRSRAYGTVPEFIDWTSIDEKVPTIVSELVRMTDITVCLYRRSIKAFSVSSKQLSEIFLEEGATIQMVDGSRRLRTHVPVEGFHNDDKIDLDADYSCFRKLDTDADYVLEAYWWITS